MPICWSANGALPPGPLPLISNIEEEWGFRQSATKLLLLTAVALLLVSFLRGGIDVFRALWPEALAAVAVAGITLGGLSPLGLGLLAAGVGLRTLWLMIMLRQVFARWFSGTPDQQAGNAASRPIPPTAPS